MEEIDALRRGGLGKSAMGGTAGDTKVRRFGPVSLTPASAALLKKWTVLARESMLDLEARRA